ncbi:cysteine--tRNA ligase [Peijinzhouia sedimentorum]
MQSQLSVYNTLSRQKEEFQPINPPFVGMYVCGPTVYGDAHLGHARPAITFDLLFRYLNHLGYKVRYVRNITDVGHLEQDADSGEDKIAKKARLEQLEPMEVAQQHTNSYHRDMALLNTLPPSIEPQASGHIPDQIEMVKQIVEKGLAYEAEGSIYFDVMKYAESEHYGKLSGRVIEDLMAGTRELDGQTDKRSPLDFALWKKASPEHIMRWQSPWSDGFPGWHVECSAMSAKYLGETFDIHGGGMDLLFPHHECEIAQSKVSHGHDPAKYWMHNNMITINGQKMGKSLGNFINLQELFTGSHKLLDRPYSPMTVRFFILQAHYRSTLDFSNEALLAAAKGYKKLMNGLRVLNELEFVPDPEVAIDEKQVEQINQLADNCYRAINDDLNTAKVVAHLFNILKKINSMQTAQLNPSAIGQEAFDLLAKTYRTFVVDILGLREEKVTEVETVIQSLLEIYAQAKADKNYDLVDQIRASLKNVGVTVKDMKTGISWAYEE